MATQLTFFYISLFAITFADCLAQNSRKELRTKQLYQDKISRLSHGMQPNSIDPSQVIQLSWHPRIFLYKGFLSDEECNYLISRGYDSAKSNTKSMPAMFGTSLDADDEIARRIEERISAWTFLPRANSKSLQVLHVGLEDPKQNYSYFHDESTEQVDEPLLATVVLYLSNVSQGGQIVFPHSENNMWSECRKSDHIHKPSRGNAVLFFNLHLNAKPDTSSSHARCPVLEGDMWCATKLFYLKGIVKVEEDVKLPQSGDADCIDEDENCSRWAATGECQRNPLFMVGSPDYYGTCRKSCNAC